MNRIRTHFSRVFVDLPSLLQLPGKVDKAKELADRLLPMCRQLGDLEGETLMNELIGRAVQERGGCLRWNFCFPIYHHLPGDSRVP